MTTVTNRRERKKIAIRGQIIATAIDLFARYGIAAVTVDQIADAADIGKGTVYNYFTTKEDIVVAFMADIEARLSPQDRRASLPPATRSTAFSPTSSSSSSGSRSLYHAFVLVFLAQMFQDTERFFPYMVEMQKSIDPPLEALFTQLRDRGLLRPGVDLPQLIMSFKTMHLGLTALWAIEGPPFRQTGQTVRRQMQFFAQGIGKKTR